MESEKSETAIDIEATEEKPKKNRYQLLMEFSEYAAPLFRDGKTSKELMDELYDDETGLPK